MTNKQVPIGIRLNNPGNLEWGDPWQGLVARSESLYTASSNAQQARFAQFVSPVYGIRALARTLITYQDKHKLRTVKEIINRWAPPVENNTKAYIEAVEKAVGGQLVDMQDYHDLKALTEAIIKHENGNGGLKTPNTWFTKAEIDEGLRLAGVRDSAVKVGGIPATVETASATASGVVGISQVVEVLPQVSIALTQADGHLSSGSTVRLVVGIIMVVIAVVIAWSQVKKYKSGVL